jgi:hypothetical protein
MVRAATIEKYSPRKIASNAPTPVLPVAAVFANDRQTGMT